MSMTSIVTTMTTMTTTTTTITTTGVTATMPPLRRQTKVVELTRVAGS